MLATQTSPAQLHERSNAFDKQVAAVDSSIQADNKSRHRYSLYPKPQSSGASTSDQSSIYNASIAPSVDENTTRPPTDPPCSPSVERSKSWFGSWRTRPTVIPTPQAAPKPDTATKAIVEARFSNNPNGTALTTIIERKSSASLRKTLSNISRRRSYTPVHTTLPRLADDEVPINLSLDEAAIREFRRIFGKHSSDDTAQGSSSTAAGDPRRELDGVRPHRPTYPPFKRTNTPPGRPRWPGDLRPGTPGWRRSSLGFRDALRGFLAPPRNDLPQLRVGTRQRELTSTMPRRVGQAYWRPPRSAHSSSSYSGQRHPFYNAPTASPLSSGHQHQIPDIASAASSPDPPTPIPSTIRPVPEESEPEVGTATFQPATSFTGVVAFEDRPTSLHANAVTMEGVAAADSVEGLPQSPSMTILPVRSTSINFDPRLQSDSPSKPTNSMQLFPRDDQASRYVADGAPTPHPGDASLCCADQEAEPQGEIAPSHERRDSVHEIDEQNLPAIRITTPAGTIQDHVRWSAGTAQTRPHLPTVNRLPSAYRSRGPSSSNENLHAPVPTSSKQKRITSAALPLLLPLAEREGIVRSIRMVPVTTDQLDDRDTPSPTRGRRNPDSRYDERLQRRRLPGNDSSRPRTPKSKVLIACVHNGPGAGSQQCWRCRVESGVKWMLQRCFCQPDEGESVELDGVRVVSP